MVGRPFSLPPTTAVPPRLGAARVWGALPQVHSHLEVALGQEAGRPGYSLETGRPWWGAGGSSGSHHQRVPPPWLAPRLEGHLRGLLWAWAPNPRRVRSAPSLPLRSEMAAAGWSEGRGSRRERVCGADGGGGRVGRGGPDGGVGFSCSQRETGGHRYYCSAGQGGPGTRGARQGL